MLSAVGRQVSLRDEKKSVACICLRISESLSHVADIGLERPRGRSL